MPSGKKLFLFNRAISTTRIEDIKIFCKYYVVQTIYFSLKLGSEQRCIILENFFLRVKRNYARPKLLGTVENVHYELCKLANVM